MKANLRLIAARIIQAVMNGQSLNDCLEPQLKQLADGRDRALVQALCYGVCRFYTQLDVLLSYLLQKPLRAKDEDVYALLLVGLYQLMAMRTPEYAAVTETVNATVALKKPWARGFVNAVLREFLREQTALRAKLETDEEAHYAHPAWWIKMLKKAWPKQWQAILLANNEHPPMTLRVNQRLTNRADYLKNLSAQQIAAESLAHTTQGVVLNAAQNAETLPGFSEGHFAVQDGAAQLAASLLELKPNLRVLDACAAPGGKLTHILELEPNLQSVVAVEKDAERLRPIKENLKRLGLQAILHCADAAQVKTWWDGEAFDRILLDAPCSGSGVIRRHPDIKLLREPEDIAQFRETQLHLLDALWPLLKPGGLLLYATCSILPTENVEVMHTFLEMHPDAKEDKINADWGVQCDVGRQILPGMAQMDGFYYARLQKLIHE
jgi:16S rRNA (cytosine967-C5)-methyltransferase